MTGYSFGDIADAVSVYRSIYSQAETCCGGEFR